DVPACHHHRDLEAVEAGLREVLHGTHGHVVRTGAADRVVDLVGGPVQGDLHVDVVGGGQAPGPLGGQTHAVGGELHAHPVGDRVVEQLPEIGADRGLAAADVDVEHLHPLELVDHGLDLVRGQFPGVAPSGRGQAVDAGQ